MKLFKNVAICSFLANAKKFDRKNNGDREAYYLKLYDGKDPTIPCTFAGQHAITGEDGFGEIYGYSLDYQSDRMGISGYVSIENYYDFMNCYVEVNANPGCDAVEVTLTSLAIQNWGKKSCRYDVAYLTDLDGNKSEKLCGCKGDGCSDLVWGRKVYSPFHDDDSYYYEYSNYNSYDSYGGATYDTDMIEFWQDAASGAPRKDRWRLSGNGFRLNIQSDDTQSHGEIKLEWTCVEDFTSTTATSTTATTTTASSTTATTTTATTTTSTTTTSTTTTEYYDRYTTYSTGTTTLTTSSADSTWNPYMTTQGDTSCAMFHNGLDSFFSQIRVGINDAIDNELMTDYPNRNSQFKNWMTKIWTKFENQLNGEAVMFDSDAEQRGCIMESVTNSPGENLSTDILGSDCRLDLEYQGIPHMCRSLTRFMNFAYSKCLTRGRGSIHWASSEEDGQKPFNAENENDTQGLLDRLEFRCKRMLEIIS